MKRIKIKDILQSGEAGQSVVAKGWVRTKRGSKNVNFIALNNFDESLLKEINTGAAISVTGKLAESAGSGQNIEMIAEELELLGGADPDKYPIQPKRHSLEFLRENAPGCGDCL